MNQLFENFNKVLPINRKERFYTGTILPSIICCNNFSHIDRFFNLIPNFNIKLSINPNADNNNILLLTEYSFKESLVENHFKEMFTDKYETKDTPDLVILITEPELILIVGEAKMFSNVNPGEINTQMNNQKWFINTLINTHNIKKENCFHFALLPQKLIFSKESLNYPVVFWEEILESYSDILEKDYFYNTLKIAISKFDNLKSTNLGNGISFGKNMESKLSGEKIIEFANSGESFWVGRFGGVNGEKFRTDVNTGNWRNFEYEINISSKAQPNNNWFSSREFANSVRNNNTFLRPKIDESVPLESSNKQPLSDWHFSHLGRDYFLEISRKLGGNGKWDIPIYQVYIGKKGVPYIEKKRGRNVNPNWAVIMQNGKEYKYKSNSNNMIEPGIWDRSNCHVFSWSEINLFFEDQLKSR